MKPYRFTLIPILLFFICPHYSVADVPGNVQSNQEAAVSVGIPESSEGLLPPTQSNTDTNSPIKLTLLEHVSLFEKMHGIIFTLDPAISTEQSLLLPEGVSVEESLKILLAGYDYYLLYGSESEKVPNRIKRVWVFPHSGSADTLVVTKISMEKELHSGETEPPACRSENVLKQDTIPSSASDASKLLDDALASGDEDNWNDALHSAIQGGVLLPQQQLEGMYNSATSDNVRADILMSIKLLPDLDPAEIQRLSDMALQDPSPIVRDMALELQKSMLPQAPYRAPEYSPDSVDVQLSQ